MATIPTLYVTESAIMEMVAEVLDHADIETAWGLYGLISSDDSQVLVTGVLRPSRSDIVRQYATTKLGGETQALAVRWLSGNFDLMKSLGLTKADDFGFAFLFKGHSHHVLRVDSYSFTDRRSILEAVEVDNLEVAIGPLATIEKLQTEIKSRSRWAGTIAIDQTSRVNLRFYVLTRSMVQEGVKQPLLVDPTVVKAASVPLLPPLGWQFVRENDFVEQIRQLTSYSCKVNVLYREIKDGPPFEVQFLVTKPNWRGILNIVTSWDYPGTAPIFEIVNQSTGLSLVADHYQGAGKNLLEGDLWEPGWDFIDAIFRLEARGDL